MFKPHRFIPRILKRATIKRKEVSGYPNRLKNKVAKAIVPRKKINLFVRSGNLNINPLLFSRFLFLKKNF